MNPATGAAQGPHQNQPVLYGGANPKLAKAAMLMVHGRGATADDMLSLSSLLHHPEFAYVAPQAAGNVWYPHLFLAPPEHNEPWIQSGHQAIQDILSNLSAQGIPPSRVILFGFSQGACLILEFAARNAQRYGGVIGLSGGLIGPDGTLRDFPGSLKSTPVFLGCSDIDPYIPKKRVLETAGVFRGLGGDVTERLYENMGHTINNEEFNFVREIMRRLVES